MAAAVIESLTVRMDETLQSSSVPPECPPEYERERGIEERTDELSLGGW